MTVKRIAIIAAFAAVGLVLAFAGLEAAQTSRHWGGMHGQSGHGFSHLCSEQRDERIDRAVSFVEAFVEFTPEQDQAWDRLTGAVRESSVAIGESCNELTDEKSSASLPQRFAHIETMMTVGLEAIHTVRPAFNAFYETLDEEQRQAIDQLMRRRHRR